MAGAEWVEIVALGRTSLAKRGLEKVQARLGERKSIAWIIFKYDLQKGPVWSPTPTSLPGGTTGS